MRTTLRPDREVFTQLESGANKVGWKVVRRGDVLTVFPPNEEMTIDTAPEIATGSMSYPSCVGVKCKNAGWDDCKKLFDQISVAANLGPATYQ